MLRGVAAEAVDAELLNPGCEPVSLELGNGHGAAAVLLGCRYIVLGIGRCPLLLQELRNIDMLSVGIVVPEVRQEAGAHFGIRAAASAVCAEPQPVLAPPVVPLGVR